MSVGIRTTFVLGANEVITNDATLNTLTGMSSPIAAGQTQQLRCWIPFTVGATGGIRFQLVVPAGGTIFLATFNLRDNVTPATITAIQVASAAFTNALAVAGTHWLEIIATVVNGLTAGNVALQAAQNTVDALSLTVLRGSSMNVVTT